MNEETALKPSDECEMLILEIACADLIEHKDNRPDCIFKPA